MDVCVAVCVVNTVNPVSYKFFGCHTNTLMYFNETLFQQYLRACAYVAISVIGLIKGHTGHLRSMNLKLG